MAFGNFFGNIVYVICLNISCCLTSKRKRCDEKSFGLLSLVQCLLNFNITVLILAGVDGGAVLGT